MKDYKPPFTITDKMTNYVYLIAQLITKIDYVKDLSRFPILQKTNRIKSVYGSIAIENNTLSLLQVTYAVTDQKIKAPLDQITEAKNCYKAYECLDDIHYLSLKDLLKVHSYMTRGMCEASGKLRTSSVGVFSGSKPVFVAPPAKQVPELIDNLFNWLKKTEVNFLIASCVFHFEFEFIHPFSDGNGRMGRLWQTAILSKHHPIFKYLPIEQTIFNHRQEYYHALQASQSLGDCTIFVEFMLSMIYKSLLDLSKEVDKAKFTYGEQVNLLLKHLDAEPKSTSEIMKLLKLKNQPNFYYNYLKPALEAKLIGMTVPDKPKSKNQKYYKK